MAKSKNIRARARLHIIIKLFAYTYEYNKYIKSKWRKKKPSICTYKNILLSRPDAVRFPGRFVPKTWLIVIKFVRGLSGIWIKKCFQRTFAYILQQYSSCDFRIYIYARRTAIFIYSHAGHLAADVCSEHRKPGMPILNHHSQKMIHRNYFWIIIPMCIIRMPYTYEMFYLMF